MSPVILLVIIILSLSAFVVGVPILYGALLPIIKPRLSKRTTTYLYAFSSGFFMILATVGFLAESKENLTHFFEPKFPNSIGLTYTVVAIVIGSVVLFALSMALFAKWKFIKKTEHEDGLYFGEGHDHDHIIFNPSDYDPKSKRLALFLLLSHRVPGGLILGLLAASIANQNGTLNESNILFLIVFVIHIVPEELIMYYRQIEMGISRWKAVRNSILSTMFLIPFIIIGSAIKFNLPEHSLEIMNELVMPIVQTLAASFLLFTSMIEFFPEFLHFKLTGKEWYKTIFLFIIGIVIGLIILAFHHHEHGPETPEAPEIINAIKSSFSLNFNGIKF